MSISKTSPKPKQSRARETVDAVISATNEALKVGGEAAVRIQEISATSRVSVGSIYHHFGDRDGLIRATYVHNFSAAITEDIGRAKRWWQNIHKASEIVEHRDEMESFLNSHFKHQSPLERASIIGNSAGRPQLHANLKEVQHKLNDELTEVMQMLQERGVLRSGLKPRAVAVMILGMLFGRVVAMLDNEPVDDSEWNQALLAAFSGFFN
jgi:AcrR family transcriptional regulator